MVKLLSSLILLSVVRLVYTAEEPKPTPEPWEGKFRLVVTDEPEKLRFSLILVSEDQRDICVDQSAWPDRDGKIETGGDGLFSIVTERETFKLHEPRLYADCWDGPECFIHVRPGDLLRGFILYSEFGDLKLIGSRAKR